MTMLEQDPSRGFSYADSVIKSEGSTPIIRKPRRGGNFIFADLLLGPQFSTGSAIVRRDCFDRVGFFDQDLRMGEDWDMWLRLACRYPGCYVPKPLLTVQVSPKADKYALELLECCTLRVLERLFSRSWPPLFSFDSTAIKPWIYAWHYAVLAKSYRARRRYRQAVRLGALALLSHPAGTRFLLGRWNVAGRWPDISYLSCP